MIKPIFSTAKQNSRFYLYRFFLPLRVVFQHMDLIVPIALSLFYSYGHILRRYKHSPAVQRVPSAHQFLVAVCQPVPGSNQRPFHASYLIIRFQAQSSNAKDNF